MDANTYKTKGDAEFTAREFHGAIENYSKAIELDPGNHILYSNRSASHAAVGDWMEADADARKCLSLQGNWAKGYVRLGDALHGLQKYEEALKAYKDGLKIEPENTTLKNAIAGIENDRSHKIEEDTNIQKEIENLKNISISTSPVLWPYEVIDIVFAIDSQEQGFFAHILENQTGVHIGANPSKAFQKVILQLKHQCLSLGGDAVISCNFEHRIAIVKGLLGGKQAVEIFAYGTVVKRISSTA